MPNKRSFAFAIGSLAAVSALSVGLVATHGKQPVNVNARPNIFKNVNVQDIGAKIGPVIVGTVTAVDGTTITVSSKLAYAPGSANSLLKATIYTVDASHATVSRINLPTPRPLGGKIVPKAVNAPPQLNVNSEPLVNVPPEPADNVNSEPPAPPEPTDNVNSEPLVNAPVNDLNAQMLVNYPVGAPGGIPGTARRTPPPSPLTNIMTKIAVSDIKIGDMVTVRGTVNGTMVTATDITVSSISVVAPVARPNKAELEQKVATLKNKVEAVKPGLWSKITNFLGGLFGKKK